MNNINKHNISRYGIYGDPDIKFEKIHSNYYPIRFDRYISICVDNNYRYWREVIEMVASTLYLNKISIVAFSSNTRANLEASLNLNGLKIRHAADVLDKSLFHFCGQDWSLTLCQNNNINKFVYIETADKSDLFVEEFSGFVSERDKPEKVAKAIFEALNIEQKIYIETELIGPSYGPRVLELVPDFQLTAPPNVDKDTLIGVRCDLVENWKFVAELLQFGISPVVISKTLPKQPVASFLTGIDSIKLYVDENTKPEDIHLVKSLGINCKLLSNKDCAKTKRNLFDFDNVFHVKNWGEKNLDILNNLAYDTRIRSKRMLVSQQGTFLSEFHWQQGLTIDSEQGNMILDGAENESFLKESDLFFYHKQFK